MTKNDRYFQKLAILCVALLMLLIVWGGIGTAPARPQESRVNALEVDIRGIESRLNRIEAQLNRIGGGTAIRVPVTPSTSNSGRNQQRLSNDSMFDRLATLAIELRERIDKIDARVSKLESRGTPRRN